MKTRQIAPEPLPASDLFGGCPPDCGHSAAEHTAFDQGLRDGEQDQNTNPYRAPLLRFAWDSGHSVGVMNREGPPNDKDLARRALDSE
jgi:hypothetical protein